MMMLLWLALFLTCCFFKIDATVLDEKNASRRLQSIWTYTDVQYGTEDPSLQLMNIALPEEEPYGVLMFHHSAGGTYNSVSIQMLNAANDSGYALVSWEGTGEGTPNILLAWSYAQTCFDFIRSSADEYGWDPNNIIVTGRSLGSITSWKLAHSQHPAIVGIYMYNALPQGAWQAPDLFYPPDDVVSPSPQTYMVFGPGPECSDGHNPMNAYPVRDKYTELGEEDKLTFIEGMWDDPNLREGDGKEGKWINDYQIFHYLPDLVARIEGRPSPTTISTPLPTPVIPTPVIPTDTGGYPYEPFTDGANCLFIGHSFFVPIARIFDTFAKQSAESSNLFPQHGFKAEFSGGQSGTPGQLWLDDGHRTSINAKLSSGSIELFGMTSFDGGDSDPQAEMDAYLETGVYPSADEFIPDYTQWIDLALSYNTDTAIFLGWHWTTNNNLFSAANFTAVNEFLCNYFYTSVVLELRQLYPDTQVLYICYGPVASKMRQMYEDNNLPDITNMIGTAPTSLFTDDLGHAGDMLKDMMGIIWLQIIYDPPPFFLQTYTNSTTPWNKNSVRDITTEVLAFNEGYNLKELAPPTNAPTTMQPSQQPTITVSSSPSMVPSYTPTVTAPFSGGICFPSESLVQVLRTEKRGQKITIIPMEQLHIDDFVLTATKDSSSYERVYSFGHYNPNLPKVEYIQFLPSGLEISANHYLYRMKKESGKFVPASEIEVGDDLIVDARREKVTKVQYVHRRGALAPLTSSGTIVVNGVLASTYAALDESSILPSWIQNQFHEWSHFVTIILRCHSWITSSEEQHTADGLSIATDRLRSATIWYFRQSSMVQSVLAIWLLPILGLMYGLEQMYNNNWWPFLFTAIIIILMSSKRMKFHKK